MTPARQGDIFVTATGNYDVITHEHMLKMKDQAIVCNIGHFDNEIDIASVEKYQWDANQAAGRPHRLPDGKRIIVLAEGRLGEPGLRHGASDLRDVGFVHQPDHCADRSCSPAPPTIRWACMCCPSIWTKKSLACT